MARDWIAIAKRAEAHIVQATGGSSYDETLRYNLVNFANDVMAEVDREQRWLLAYAEPTVVTVAGTQTYGVPSPNPPVTAAVSSHTTIKRVYWRDAAGKPHELLRYDKSELQRMYGDPTATNLNRGQPKYFALEPIQSQIGGINYGAPTMQMVVYPTPDASGPDTNNYTLRVGAYWATPPIIETQGNTTAVSQTIIFTVAGSGTYLVAAGVPTEGSTSTMSVRGCGAPTGLAAPNANDDVIGFWTALVANQVVIGSPAQIITTGSQVFFNSTNWMISFWPKVILFGVLREVASYYGDQVHYPIWEARFQEQLERMRKYDFDRARGFDQEALAVSGQLAASLRRIDGFSTIDVRG